MGVLLLPGRNEGNLGFIATAAICDSLPLYRLYYPSNGDHLYTLSATERDATVQQGYQDEGIAGHVWSAP